MAGVFLTGASGFLGRKVEARLRERGHRVTVLSRQTSGDLLNPASYERQIDAQDVVVHLAAVTGKASPEAYDRINVDGTRALIDAARRAGTARFVFCSSIAVTFADTRQYPYARSKAAAERLVLDSGLDATIIRPTIIAGHGSPVMSRLAALATLPVVPAFAGARALVQPILVDDLAALTVDLVEANGYRSAILEFGGPERLPLRDLLDQCARRIAGRPARFLPVPLGPVVPMLAVLERVALGMLPLTIGQLATFRFDGVASPNALWESRRDHLATVDQMIAASAPA